ncbi:HotDog domain-containing protein [Aspergillus minisclerotigenes]|uniref:HotDog domain-containing protein n=1 Tax=Aspergillus minisclerotigenes TaxID=656917 RepID=A0A5N6JJ35_9EURO|nr:HotDog domain-containing protein [Aspergillus minisclerotigenes]
MMPHFDPYKSHAMSGSALFPSQRPPPSYPGSIPSQWIKHDIDYRQDRRSIPYQFSLIISPLHNLHCTIPLYQRSTRYPNMAPKEIEAKKRRTRSDYVFHQVYRTRWFDNDMYAHLNNTVYAMLFDSIVNSWLIAECGMDPFSINNKGSDSSAKAKTNSASQVGIMVNSYCDYFASVAFPDVLDLGLRVAKLGSSSVTYEVGVFRQGEEEVKVVGGYTHVFVARETMRPTKAGMEERGDYVAGVEIP